MLTYHGKSLDACLWVIKHYKHNEMYFNNQTVQKWIQESEKIVDKYKWKYYI